MAGADSLVSQWLIWGCFFGAVVHSLFAHLFLRKAKEEESNGNEGSTLHVICQLFGHKTSIFALWLLPLFAMIWSRSGQEETAMILSGSDLTEPFANFTFIFLALSSTVRKFFTALVNSVSRLFGGSNVAWWCSCLLLGALMDGIISEAAVIVLVCSAFANRFYAHRPSSKFCYLTLALLLSILGLANLLVPYNITESMDLSSGWGWTHWTIAQELSWRVALTTLVLIALGAFLLKNDLEKLPTDSKSASLGETLTPALFGYLVAFVVAGYFEHISYFLIALVALISVVEKGDQRESHAARLNLPLLIALFNYSMELYAYLLAPSIANLYEQYGSQASLLTLGLSGLNEHLPGQAFVQTMAISGSEGCGLMMLALGAGLTLFATSVNVLAGKLLRRHFPGGAISGGLFVGYAIPVTLVAFIVIQLTYLLVP